MNASKKWPLGEVRNSKTWMPLQKGDVVDIVAPGSGTEKQVLRKAIHFLESLDLEPRVPKGLLGKEVLFSNSDAYRFRTLKEALLNQESRAIWCLRGGYGSIRLLPELERVKKPKFPKLFIGFSDITSIHSFLNSTWGWPTLHGPNLDRFCLQQDSKRDFAETVRILFGWEDRVTFKNLKAMNKAAKSRRTIVSAVVGGNLCVLASHLGTPWQADLSGKILFLEDRGEKNHRLDRMLTQLQQAGMFKNLKAMVFGDFTMEDPKEERLLWRDSLQRFADSASFPVLKGLACGHGKRQRLMPLLTKCRLELSTKNAQLALATGVCNLNNYV